MANLKSLKIRIKSVKSTQKITKAMKMVAASRLKKSRQSVESFRFYNNKLSRMLEDFSVGIEASEIKDLPMMSGSGKSNSYLLIIVSSDRGLCGGLNSSIVKSTKLRITQLIAQGKEVKLYFVGKKAYDQLKTYYSDFVAGTQFGVFKSKIGFNVAEQISDDLLKLFREDAFDVCEIIYNKFKSAIVQEQVRIQLIPFLIQDKAETVDFVTACEPGAKEVVSSLLPRIFTSRIYNSLLESSASEQGARMTAMESATNNANKMIKDLTLVYNRTRQANITRELIDIVSGANSI